MKKLYMKSDCFFIVQKSWICDHFYEGNKSRERQI